MQCISSGMKPSDISEAESAAPIQLWLRSINLVDINDAALANDRDLLDERELRCEVAFARAEDRRHYVAAHALVRRAMTHYVSGVVCPGDWHIAIGDGGKPRAYAQLIDDIEFSMSHTCGLVGVAVTRGYSVGFDIEALTEHVGIESLADLFFPAEEVASWHDLAGNKLRQRAFAHWTLKEAYGKAVGYGIPAALQNSHFCLRKSGFVRARISNQFGMGEGWHFWHSFFLRRFSVALCAASTAVPQLELFEIGADGRKLELNLGECRSSHGRF